MGLNRDEHRRKESLELLCRGSEFEFIFAFCNEQGVDADDITFRQMPSLTACTARKVQTCAAFCASSAAETLRVLCLSLAKMPKSEEQHLNASAEECDNEVNAPKSSGQRNSDTQQVDVVFSIGGDATAKRRTRTISSRSCIPAESCR